MICVISQKHFPLSKVQRNREREIHRTQNQNRVYLKNKNTDTLNACY